MPLPSMTRPIVLVAAPALVACARVAPPASSPPSADDALARMRATYACANGVQASAKIDHVGDGGRARADMLLYAARPARLRMDVVSPFGAAVATLTSDGSKFALSDLRGKRFFVGPASACNIARFTTVAVPGHAFVDLLRGEAPVLKHQAVGTAIVWSPQGYWVLSIGGSRDAHEEIHMAPTPEDWTLPWDRQRMRILDVRVEQQGFVLYHAELSDHSAAATAGPRLDPDGLSPPLPPSGPECHAEIPRKIHVEVRSPASDVRFLYRDVHWNPPLPADVFDQQPPPGMTIEPVTCE